MRLGCVIWLIVGVFLAAGLGLVFAAGYWGTKAVDNLNGICHEIGRELTRNEKRQRILDQINHSVRVDNWKPGDPLYPKVPEEFGLGMFTFKHQAKDYKLGHQDKFTKDAKFKPYTSYDDENLKIYFYPDVPVDVRSPMVGINESANKNEGGWPGYGYRPVDNWYKITGYAHDVFYIKMKVHVDPGGGPPFSYYFQSNGWINACGYNVSLPEKYYE